MRTPKAIRPLAKDMGGARTCPLGGEHIRAFTYALLFLTLTRLYPHANGGGAARMCLGSLSLSLSIPLGFFAYYLPIGFPVY